MANEGQKRSLIDSIARADKDIITLQSDIKRKNEQSNTLAIELDRANTADARKKTIINTRSSLQKDIISLEKRMKDKVDSRNKDTIKLNNLS